MSTASRLTAPARLLRPTRLRRVVMLLIVALLLAQYAGSDLLVGSLSASVFAGTIKLLDVFAFVESQAAARGLALAAVVAVTPVALLYLLFGRAFCGWVCPMDLLFSLVSRNRRVPLRLNPRLGYGLLGALLLAAVATGIPLFSSYLSHLTNLFRALGGVFATEPVPGGTTVVTVSASLIVLLLVLEYFFPRLWCRILCPVGKTYGLFNRLSLLRLRFAASGCNRCRQCESACYMGVEIIDNPQKNELRDANCIYCGRCEDVCRKQTGAVRLALSRAARHH